jgi:hypothetical protein
LAYIGFHTFEAKKYFFPQYTLEKHINAVTHMFRQKDIKHQKEEFGGVILEPERLFPADTDPEAIIIEIAVQHGLFVTQANDSFSFSHLTFQEYFAARYLVANTPQGTLEQLLNHIDDTQWREVFLLTAGLLEETDAEHFFDQFIARLDKMVVNTKLIQGILQWAMEKPMAHESPALRAWYHSLALDYAHDLAYDYSRADDRLPYFPRYEVRTIARSLARDLELEKFHSLTEIDYKSVVWNETSEKIYAAYVRGTALLVECLALATVFDRKAIEARLLCPASEDGIE